MGLMSSLPPRGAFDQWLQGSAGSVREARHNPVGVGTAPPLPQVARSGQPGAIKHNPVGVARPKTRPNHTVLPESCGGFFGFGTPMAFCETSPASLPGEVAFDRLRTLSKRSASKRLVARKERGERVARRRASLGQSAALPTPTRFVARTGGRCGQSASCALWRESSLDLASPAADSPRRHGDRRPVSPLRRRFRPSSMA